MSVERTQGRLNEHLLTQKTHHLMKGENEKAILFLLHQNDCHLVSVFGQLSESLQCCLKAVFRLNNQFVQTAETGLK